MSLRPESRRGTRASRADPCRGRLVGRDAELSQLRGLVDPVPAGSRVLVVLGDPGMGKSVLLADMTKQARAGGMQVLSVTGRESEANLAFAGLHQLLRPILAYASALPAQQDRALQGALGLTAEPVPANRLLTGIAALALLAEASERSPVLVVVDDAHWLDPTSLDVLAFVGHRLDAERVVLVLASRGPAAPSGLDSGFLELRLEPLPEPHANRLLDGLPDPPRGRARAQVRAQAAGNPLALIELAQVIAADPAAWRRWAAEPLPLTSRLAAVIAARFADLPEPTQAALLLAAVADGPLLSAAASMDGLAPDVLIPAERLGLIKVDQSGLKFSHPLTRSAIYHAAPFAQRAAAHRRLAKALEDQPDRQAWHLAAASLQPDERVASLLEATAAVAQRRGGSAAAAQALERAAELSPNRTEKARRLVCAATIAIPTGQADWIQDLANQALAVTSDPELRIRARRARGWALVWSNQQAAALSTLISVAEEASSQLPILGWEALAIAAAVAYQYGAPAALQRVGATLRLLEHGGPLVLDPARYPEVDVLRLWIQSAIGLNLGRCDVARRLDRLASLPLAPHVLYRAGSAAWILDQSELAIRLLRPPRQQLQPPEARGAQGGSLSALGWALIDAGRWDEALAFAAEADDLAAAYQMGLVGASAGLLTATVLALRGDGQAARASTSNALVNDPERSRAMTARAQHILGVAALAEGSYLMAFAQLRKLFANDGTPLHPHVSYLAVADLAAAAIRADRRIEGRQIVQRAHARLDRTPSPRLQQLLARAHGILAEPSRAEAHFGPAAAGQAGNQWPFEHAQLELDYAEWLRRRRRINEAKAILTPALETFQQLRARPSIRRAETELRACGVAVADALPVPGGLQDLTPQQRQIIRLASTGLTNREIADRLFLSPRTVSSHLYRSYPKLGVTGRHQLHQIITVAGPPVAAGETAGDQALLPPSLVTPAVIVTWAGIGWLACARHGCGSCLDELRYLVRMGDHRYVT
jgi:DNA-binding CsgD family transcriptional regulator/tetratricopeptide (TPR) repeat protein